MKTKVQRWGNSLAVRIPKTLAEEVGLTDDSPIEMRPWKVGYSWSLHLRGHSAHDARVRQWATLRPSRPKVS